MDYRLNSAPMIALAVLIIGALGLFGYTYFFKDEPVEEPAPEEAALEETAEVRTITAKHQFATGTHVIAGETDVPTPCHRLETTAFFKNGTQNEVEIRFDASMAEGEICAQVITPARFKVEFEAPEDAILTATWNGQPATLNLIPATAEENLDDYEVFIKG